MKKLVLACMVLFVVAALTAPPAQALPICFKWSQFCDGVQVNQQGIGGASWYHFDCANNSPMDASPAGSYTNNCAGGNGQRALRSVAPNGPGNWYFIVDSPLDGNLDMLNGTYPNGTCWIDQLAYNLQMGACTGLEGEGARPETSSIQ